ncbi:MAG TPA: S49 family peptidase, partial [Tepidisphaeraceae bacterium]|nr:S49 family peptidase [Tepidisphaeraceae bacterium]
MIRQICLALLVMCTGVLADAPAPQPTPAPAGVVVPTTQPATQPSARHRRERAAQVAAPTTAPSTQPSANAASKFPTPDELMAKIREQQTEQSRKLKVAYFDLGAPLSEAPAGFSLFGGSSQTLHDLLTRLAKARDDQDVRAVLITLKPGFGANLAQAQELRDMLAEIRRAGKRTFVYADSYDTVSYLIASAGTDVCILGGGELFMPGLSIETMFFRGVMDKVGVQPDFIQIGEYKGADEPYMRTTPSDELRAEMNKIVESYYNQIVASVSLSRNLSGDAVRQVIDEAIVSAEQGRQRGLIDHVTDIDGLRELLASELSEEVNLLADYGQIETPELNFDNPLLLISQLMRKPPESDKPAVALIYAEGVISDGDGSGGLFSSGGVGSENMRKALRIAHRDERIKAIVIRIDSPGGSALASEAMWQAIRRVGKDKPVIISIGGMAASGGYYLAVAGDYLYADPGAIVGSIGVVGGKFVLKGLYDWAGLTTEEFSRGRNANLFSSTA